MNEDDYDLIRQLKRNTRGHAAADLLEGLNERQYGYVCRKFRVKEDMELYAEEELVRKRRYQELRCEMPGTPRSSFLMVFSADGTKVASTHGNHNIYVTDIRSGKNIKTLVGHPRTPWCIAFHPTCNQIVASGCLGGQVRIWDLSGGSEVWTTGSASVIASIAFHPNDRVLVIATVNEIYFWDWSKPEPFVHVATSNPKEKVRYVAFDQLGHKLITGIANSPQTRWERVRAPVPVPRQAERSAFPYRRRIRITPQYIHFDQQQQQEQQQQQQQNPTIETANPATTSSTVTPTQPCVSEREICVTTVNSCYDNLIREYKQLIESLRGIRQSIMIDRGTDPMEPTTPINSSSTSSGTQTISSEEPQPSASTSTQQDDPQPSTSSGQPSSTPEVSLSGISKIIKREPRKHKATESVAGDTQDKRIKCDSNSPRPSTSSAGASGPSGEQNLTDVGCQTQSPRRVLVIKSETQLEDSEKPCSSSQADEVPKDCGELSSLPDRSQPSTSCPSVEAGGRPNVELEIRNKILPIIMSVPPNDRPELIRLFENNRQQVSSNVTPFWKKATRRHTIYVSSSDGSSSDDDISSLTPPSDGGGTSRPNLYTHHVTTTDSPLSPDAPSPASIHNTSPTSSTTNTSPPALSSTSPPNLTTNTPEVTRPTPPTQPQPTQNSDLDQLLTALLAELRGRENEQTRAPSAPSPVDPATDNLTWFLNRQARDSSPVNVPTTTMASTTPDNPSMVNTNTRTTNSTIYTSSSGPRRRFFSHRVSAFMPTRVHYTRSPPRMRRNSHLWCRSRLGRSLGNGPFALDELINYSERANSEDDPPVNNRPNLLPNHPRPPIPNQNPPNPPRLPFRAGYGIPAKIVQDLEASLNDLRSIRVNLRPPSETSELFNSSLACLERIIAQSNTILRNLRSSIDILGPPGPPPAGGEGPSRPEPSLAFYDQNFYVRDQRNLSDSPDDSGGFNAVAADHNYPRNPDDGGGENVISPLMTNLHIVIMQIQWQAILLRREVEKIERIDRAMIEVAQLRVIRGMIYEFLDMMGGRNTGMTSVRQMMAGTRISDSAPPGNSNNSNINQTNSTTSSSSSSPSPSPTTSASAASGENRSEAPTNRNYHPRPVIFTHSHRQNFRYMMRCYLRQRRTGGTPTPVAGLPGRLHFHTINASTLSLMTRQMARQLNDQMRNFTRPQDPPQQPSANRASNIDLGEHILSLRLHGSVIRLNHALRTMSGDTANRFRTDPTMAVTQDGVSRISYRHTLSIIMDGLSRHVPELSAGMLNEDLRLGVNCLLIMSLLLCELLLLQIVNGIPPPAPVTVDPGREALINRLRQMWQQMMQNRFSMPQANQLTRSLRVASLAMLYANRALGRTYLARHNAMLPSPDSNRTELWASLNSCLRNRFPNATAPEEGSTSSNAPQESDSSAPPSDEALMLRLTSTIRDIIARFSNSTEETPPVPSTSAEQTDNWSNNSDENDDEGDWNSEYSSYRNRNLPTTTGGGGAWLAGNTWSSQAAQNSQAPASRPWMVPSVQINDVPVSEPLMFPSRMQLHRRYADRISEPRYLPNIALFRPRFLHPLYASVNPFDADLDDPQREPIHESDMVTTVTPNHRIQAWDISDWTVPAISDPLKNVVINECKIHNDASVDVAKDGSILVTLLPSGGYLNVTNRLGVYSLKWETLGQCLYTTNFDQNAVSVSLSPLARHLVVGLAARQMSIVPNDRWTMARIFKIEHKDDPSDRLPLIKELEHNRDNRINCIRWLPTSGQGLIYASNAGQLVVLT